MGKRVILLIFSVLLLDQALKLWIKTHMFLGEEFHIADWFIIHFTENNGMAFGMELGGDYGKYFLSIFRLVAVGALGWLLYSMIKKNESHKWFIYSIALIMAGAIGNILDSLFYGVLFSDSNFQVAEFLPADGGYASFLQGRVVDMFYFPIIEGHFPAWFPIWGTEEFIFFRPVFNIADASISVGVGIVLVFQKSFFTTNKPESSKLESTTTASNESLADDSNTLEKKDVV